MSKSTSPFNQQGSGTREERAIDIALNKFIQSGALATNEVPNFLRDAYFRAGHRSRDIEVGNLNGRIFKLDKLLQAKETGYGVEHEAFRYRQIHEAVEKMGGWANYRHWALKHSESHFKALEEAQKELDLCAEIITCVKCPEKKTCEFAFDSYNTNGDCLANK